MAAKKKKVDGRTKAGKALLTKALEKALKGKKLGKKAAGKAKAKKTGRPAIAPHVKIAKKFKPESLVAVKSREGIVGEVSHYIYDGKKAVIRRGVEKYAETLTVVPTVKLRSATQFEALAYVEMVELIENLRAHLERKAEEAVKVVEAQPAIDPAFNVVETVEEQLTMSDDEAIRVVEEVLKASQDDLTFSE